MPIRFHCRRCGQLLGIATRKAGTEVQCPSCTFPQTVPSGVAAAATVAMSRSARPEQEVGRGSGAGGYDDEAAMIGALGGRGVNHTVPIPRASVEALPRAVYEAGRPMPSGTILYRRRTLYIHGILFLLLAGGAFVGGYFVGRGDATLARQVARKHASRERVLLDGKLYYDTGAGSIAPDAGAVFIALPAGKFPRATLSIQGLRPRDPPPAPTGESVRTLEDFGGVYARADQAGAFSVVLPEAGKYRVLIISRQTARDKETGIDELDLSEMTKYFYRADDLVGRHNYRWTLEEITGGSASLDHNFGRDGGE